MVKYCIFDLDGTIFNTLTTITHYINLTLAARGLSPITEQECCSFIGHGACTLIRLTVESKGIFDSEYTADVHKEYNRRYNENTLYLTKPYDGIPELLAGLKANGVRLGVLSNKPDVTTNLIINSYFEGMFDDVRGGREGVALKPAPDALLSMIADAGLTPDEVMYIGDTGVDIKTGLGAGVKRTVGVSWGFRSREELITAGAELIVDHPLGILDEVLADA
ncbi:MAG: HAD family hydrolase [Clostridia bacterium]|nr:HAD family hydrolase [Clostridia bacterium]